MRLIDADAYVKYCDEKWISLNVDAVNAQPTIEARKTGQWIPHSIKDSLFYCSNCNAMPTNKTRFCPNCGARMVSDEQQK